MTEARPSARATDPDHEASHRATKRPPPSRKSSSPDGWSRDRRSKSSNSNSPAYIGAAHGVAATSCTTALHLAVAALGLRRRRSHRSGIHLDLDRQRCRVHGCHARFRRHRPRDLQHRCRSHAAAVTDRTVGIIPVHLFGLCADMERVNALARAASGCWRMPPAGSARGSATHTRARSADAGASASIPARPSRPAKAGCSRPRRASWPRIARSLSDHGADRTDLERQRASDGTLLPAYRRLGFNYRMTDVQAAIGIVQMGRPRTCWRRGASRRAVRRCARVHGVADRA